MAFQLDGEWTAKIHGLAGVFPPERVQTALQTIKRCNIALTSDFGAANFALPDGGAMPSDSGVAAYGTHTMFSAEVLLLAMTYIYAGEHEYGIDLASRYWDNAVRRQRHPWDLPVMISGDTGKRKLGTDYYQNMMLWTLPLVAAGENLSTAGQSGGLIDRILIAGAEPSGV